MYKISISIDEDQVYEQRLETLDLKGVIDAVNRAPQPQRERRTRSDAGSKRAVLTATNNTADPDPFG
jgi:hypothetical protein